MAWNGGSKAGMCPLHEETAQRERLRKWLEGWERAQKGCEADSLSLLSHEVEQVVLSEV